MHHRLLRRIEAHLQSIARLFGLHLSKVVLPGKESVPCSHGGVCGRVKAGVLTTAASIDWPEQSAVHAEVFAGTRFGAWGVPVLAADQLQVGG